MDFFGQFEHTIDDKGRVVLPAAWREGLSEGGFSVLLGDYAALFTPSGWERQLRRMEQSGKFTRRELQAMSALASPFKPDSQHRLALGAKLRQRGRLEREVTIVGSQSHAAIYSRDEWQDLEDAAFGPNDSGPTMAEKINDLGFL